MSRIALYFCLFTFVVAHCYYPKWTKDRTEATISWDVSGYYMYLPALFIYKDIKKCGFKDDILKKYKMTPDFQQAFIHEASGNYVMKYSIGQAVLYSPFFAIAHVWALNDSRYLADGFSFPYQFMIAVWMMILAFIGIIYLRKSLLVYFDEWPVALGLLGITLGSNYLTYAAIDSAMTHNTLFTIYSLLIYVTIHFHKNPTFKKGLGIGFLVGMAALIRPTEIISCLIPILWGANMMKKDAFNHRLQFLGKHWSYLLFAIIFTLGIGSIQLIYWKYASGDWIVYSYEDQGFSWLSPHILDCMFSYRSGWLIYSPLMSFALIGFYFLFKKDKNLFFTCFVFSLLFMYITFAWDIWWYGGSLGQRAMVQAYPVLVFPLCASAEKLMHIQSKLARLSIGAIAILFIYASLWFTFQSHRGGLVHVGSMNKAYFWQTLFTFEKNKEDLKLLDRVPELYEDSLNNVQLIYEDTAYNQVMDNKRKFGKKVTVEAGKLPIDSDWIRVSADVSFPIIEYDKWKMAQFIVQFKNGDDAVTDNMYRIHRIMKPEVRENIYLDVRKPDELFKTLEIYFWNVQSQKEITIHTIMVESFEE